MHPKHALENLRNRRLKISRFADCNDPFELESVDLTEPGFRSEYLKLRKSLNCDNGLLCFSKNWQSSIMWSHYADRHRGLCLALDVNSSKTFDVSYSSQRLFPGICLDNFLEKVGENQMSEMLGTKALAWAYEEEVRMTCPLDPNSGEGGLYFMDFGGDLVLREVLLGPSCEKSPKTILDVLQQDDLPVIQTQRSKSTFDVERASEDAST